MNIFESDVGNYKFLWKNKLFSISRFLRISEKKNLVALFHQLAPLPVYIYSQFWKKFIEEVKLRCISESRDLFIEELISLKLIVKCGDTKDEIILSQTRSKVLNNLNRPTILYLMLSQGCNFACTYCPVPKLSEKIGQNLLSFENAVAGINLWLAHILERGEDNDPFFLIFYGGEPLLNRKVLEQLIYYISDEKCKGRMPERLEIMICTNGVLIDEVLAKTFFKHNVTVAIGVDGPQYYNDKVRIDNNQKPVFGEIKRAIHLLIRENVKVVASTTITAENLNCLREYYLFFRGLGVSQFGFNLMKGNALNQELSKVSLDEYCKKSVKSIIEGVKEKSNEGVFFEYQLQKKLDFLYKGMPFSIDCTCYGNQIVIQADGQVTNCPFLRFDQGHIQDLPNTFRIQRTEIVEKWRSRLSLFNDRVWTESLLNGGGCAWSSFELSGNIMSEDILNTEFTKEITDGLIWKLLPKEYAEMLNQEKIDYWSNRRIWDL